MRLQSDARSMSIDDALDQHYNVRILDVITKQTLIGTLITCSSTAFMVTTSVFYHFLHPVDTDKEYMACYIARAVEGMLISYLLYLGLNINDAAYRKICSRCHMNCFGCAVNR